MQMNFSKAAEMKLVESSNTGLKSHTQVANQQALEEFITDPQAIAPILILVTIALTIMIRKKR